MKYFIRRIAIFTFFMMSALLMSGPVYAATNGSTNQPHVLHNTGADIGRYIVNYNELKAKHPECNSDSASRVCDTAASRFCSANGFNSGLGLVGTHGFGGEIVCTSSAASTTIHTTFKALKDRHMACIPAHARLDVCQAAVNRFCRLNNFPGGGYGPIEFNNTVAVVTCVNEAFATRMQAAYSELSGFDTGCAGRSNMSSSSCLIAVDRYCQRKGFAGSQRVAETTDTHAITYCLKDDTVLDINAGAPIVLHEEGSDIGRYIVHYDDLAIEPAGHSECDRDSASRVCDTAASRFCSSKGFHSGFGLVNTYGTGGELICTSSAASAIIHTTFDNLNSHHADCNTSARARSGVCQEAVNRFCRANNFPGGGYGPIEFSSSVAVVTCVQGNHANAVEAAYTDLSTYDSRCNGLNKIASTSCLKAADQLCQRNGFVASQRIAESSPTGVTAYCLTEEKPTTVIYDPRLENAVLSNAYFSASRLIAPRVTPISRFVGNAAINEALDNGNLAQLPNHLGLFLTRRANEEGEGEDMMLSGGFSIDLVSVAWPTLNRNNRDTRPSKTVFVETILQTPLQVNDPTYGTITVNTAYDPSIIEHNGRYWIAFECQALNGEGLINRSVSTCLVAYTVEGGVDLDTFKVLISGRNYLTNENGETLDETADAAGIYQVVSASVPNIFKHKGKPYIYWVVANENRDNLDVSTAFESVQTRGVELVWSEKQQTFFVKGHNNDVFETNHPRSVVIADETYQPDPSVDELFAAKTADVSDVYSDGDNVFATILVGETCTTPTDSEPEPPAVYVHIDNCYRVSIAKSESPLKRRGFNGGSLGIFPDQSIEYPTFIERPRAATGIRTDLNGNTLIRDRGDDIFVTAQVTESYAGKGIIERVRFLFPLTFTAPRQTTDLCAGKPLGWGIYNGVCSPTCPTLGGQPADLGQTCSALDSQQSRWLRAGEAQGSRACCVRE